MLPELLFVWVEIEAILKIAFICLLLVKINIDLPFILERINLFRLPIDESCRFVL